MRFSRRSFAGAVLAMVLGATSAAACGGDDGGSGTAAPKEGTTATAAGTATSHPGAGDAEWQGIVEAAKKEGRVVFYSGLPEKQHEMIADGWAEVYPDIKLEIVRVQTRELGARIEVESKGGVGGADMIQSNSWLVWDPLEAAGQLRTVESPWLEARAELLAAKPELRMTDNTVIFTSLPYLIAWNKTLVDKPITSYQDLIDRADEFRGQVGAPDFLGVASRSWYAQLEEKLTGLDLPAELEKGNNLPDGYLRKYGALDPVIRDTALPLTQAVAAGEIKATIYTVASIVDELKAAGAPLETVLPSDAVVVNALAFGLPTWGEHPNAAQVLADFLLSPEGQKATNALDMIALDDDVPGSAGGPDDLEVPRRQLSDPDFLASFERYWTETMR
jgi:iron(III) transport system substrate-binding protein